jgi:hypothetical protein
MSRRQHRPSVAKQVDGVFVLLGQMVEQLFDYSIGTSESWQALDPEDSYAHDKPAANGTLTC